MMAEMILGDEATLKAQLQTRGFLTLQEPASGAGGMIIAAAHVLADAGINYQQALHVTAIDVDRRCAHMTFLQLALLHIPAVVIQGNALTLETVETWCTPAHILGGWSRRLRRQQPVSDAEQLLMPQPKPIQQKHNTDVPEQHVEQAISKGIQEGQMSLF